CELSRSRRQFSFPVALSQTWSVRSATPATLLPSGANTANLISSRWSRRRVSPSRPGRSAACSRGGTGPAFGPAGGPPSQTAPAGGGPRPGTRANPRQQPGRRPRPQGRVGRPGRVGDERRGEGGAGGRDPDAGREESRGQGPAAAGQPRGEEPPGALEPAV